MFNRKIKNEKEPVNINMLQELCSLYENCDDLLIARDLTIILLNFAGFLRFYGLSSLKCKDFVIYHEYDFPIHYRFINMLMIPSIY